MVSRGFTVVLLVLLMHCQSPAEVTLVHDDFDGSELDSAWSVHLDYEPPASGWVYSVAAGTLAVSDVGGFASDTWSAARLLRACRATGDFQLECRFSWDTEVSNSAMQQFRVALRDTGGNHLASAVYNDCWIFEAGSAYASAGGESYESEEKLPYAGEAVARIERTEGTVRIFWDSEEVLTASESAPAETLELSFWFYWYQLSFFGMECVDYVTVTAPETPVEAVTWTRIKSLYR